MLPSSTVTIASERPTALGAGAVVEAAVDVGDDAAHPASLAPWKLRPIALNDRTLREAFTKVLSLSESLPPEDRLIMYDANDLPSDCTVALAPGVRKRLDPRRNTKPKKPDAQLLVCTPFDPNGFNFSKIRNPGERMLSLTLQGAEYSVLTNKFPLFPKHMLLVANALVPQQLTLGHLLAVTELLQATTFCAYFNSWCASASINHFHCHLIDESPPVTALPLTPGPLVEGVRCLVPQGYPGFCYVFEVSSHARIVEQVVRSMQEDNQPHNLLVTPVHIYVWPKPLARPDRSFELYPETVGGPELLGSFTVYQEAHFSALTSEDAMELIRINTAPLPSRLLHRETRPGLGLDDAALTANSSSSDLVAYSEEADDANAAKTPQATANQGAKVLAGGVRQIPTSKSVDLWERGLLPSMTSRRSSPATVWSGRRRDAGAGKS